MTVLDNVAYALRVRGMARGERHAKARTRPDDADHALLRKGAVRPGNVPELSVSGMGDRMSHRHEIVDDDTLVQPQSRSEEHTSELQSLMRISYAVFCLNNKKQKHILQSHVSF